VGVGLWLERGKTNKAAGRRLGRPGQGADQALLELGSSGRVLGGSAIALCAL
jgi:hypothetical protein